MVNLSRFAPVSEAHAEREGAGKIPSGARDLRSPMEDHSATGRSKAFPWF